ncbi:hypothetical protein PM082_024724 [Marasmius tenuissimus]|nr:hypothetical protein PM082_024724 [Marasmius tenuissimus]
MSEDLCIGWSDRGIIRAAKILGCRMEDIIPTTNHLESFNRVLKHKHIAGQQRSGRRLRVDILLHFTVTKMMPSIFEQRDMVRAACHQRNEWIRSLPGGESLLQGQVSPIQFQQLPSVAYLVEDHARATAAISILNHRQLGAPAFDPEKGLYTFECYSSLATEYDANPQLYEIKIYTNNITSCTCPDFSSHGGACKHLRAALMTIDQYCQTPTLRNLPQVDLPASEQAARALLLKLTSAPVLDNPTVPMPTDRAADVLQALVEAGSELSRDESEHVSEGGEALVNGFGDGEHEREWDTDTEEAISSPIPPSSPEISHSNLPVEPEALKPDTSEVKQSVKDGVQAQAVACTLFELDSMSPRLHELAMIFPQNIPLPSPHENLSRAVEAISRLRSLADLIQAAVDATEPPVDSLVPHVPAPPIGPAHVFEPKTSIQKRPFDPKSGLPLLAPSPEKKQKRKDSRSVH